jgi:transcriptional regulator with XRE-family HTH domain
MPRKRYQPEEIIQHLRTLEIEQAKGVSLEEAAKKIGVTVTTLVRWRNEFGGLKLDQAKRLRELEQENIRLKRIVANQVIDIDILKIAASGNF